MSAGPANETVVPISFDEDGISGTSGCNSYAGPERVHDGSITIDAQSLIHTERVCEGEDGLMEQETGTLDCYRG